MTAGVAAGLGWMVLVLDALPWVELEVSPAARLLCAAAAATLTLLVGIWRWQRPVEEVFDAGREYERRCVLRELNNMRPGSVTPLRRSGDRTVVTERIKGGAR